ncbi:MAG: DUF3696 domain-containing protein [Planctomycetales bacterium]|nr:DUF3696 domain-containing protein [Planctomycetales bacterium]
MNANLILRAMTLRGIGSYLHGSRLEFRPLTILCGTNGSGKSSWFNALNSLKDSLKRDPAFPMTCQNNMVSVQELDNTNSAVVLLEANDSSASFFDKLYEDEFGPPCTIGLQFEATTDFALQKVVQGDATNVAKLQDFFWQGKCNQGTTFRVRIAHPSHWAEGDGGIPGLWHFVELQIDDQFIVRFKGRGFFGASEDDLYLVECSAGFLPQMSGVDSENLIEIGTYRQSSDEVRPTAGILDEEDARLFINAACLRIRELLKMLLDGMFYISAIRKPYLHSGSEPDALQLSISEYEDKEKFSEESALIDSRNVGSEGQNAWFLESYFALNHMRVTDPTRPWMMGTIRFEGYISRWTETLLNTNVVLGEDDVVEKELSDRYPAIQTGFLKQEKPDLDQLKRYYGDYSVPNAWDEGKLLHPCFPTQPQIPRLMSSGFHQLFPLIVQAGLMRRFELMAVENPEVHLHPGLQLRIANFLIEHAKAGKWIIIETHSDLIIRRVLRAILEEQIGQAEVQICFADIEKSEKQYQSFHKRVFFYHYSTLTPMEIDEQGRIKNWPRGFLDDDVKESQRLMEIMYPPPPDDREEE